MIIFKESVWVEKHILASDGASIFIDSYLYRRFKQIPKQSLVQSRYLGNGYHTSPSTDTLFTNYSILNIKKVFPNAV